MQINSLNANPASAASAAITSNKANYNTFLQLLVTELRNQDPTKPMDPTQTVTQLATFSAVEQSVKTNSLLNSLLETSQLNQAASLVGKTITTADGAVQGIVKSVSLSSEGLVATLSDGSVVALGPGITIS